MISKKFRLKNLLRPGSITITGEPINEQPGNIVKCLETVAERIGWKNGRTEDEKLLEKKTGKCRGKGIAVFHKAPAMPSNAATSALIQMNEDGSLRFNVAGIDMGQGAYTAMSQMICQRLQVPIEKAHAVYETNTDSATYDWQTVASRMTILGGNAVLQACDDMEEQILELGAVVLRSSKRDLALGDECVFVKQFPEDKVFYKDMAVGYTYPNGNDMGDPLIGRVKYIAQGLTILDKETGQGRPALDWTYGAHAFEIEVDINTGDIKILKVVTAIDLGHVINKMLVKGQMVGGIIQGIGTALSEILKYDSEGRLLTKSFVDYKIPTMRDLPESIEICYIETPQLDGPYGARGCAEHPMISITSAIGNAIADATGTDIFETPFSADKVYAALNKII
ncbi:xanthine dehydrogenase family protein molybdopterin-binding subunit [Clostridium sp. Mt-5]|uniref:Xanthine dehydrogenase family protein molybdopterin-binding subunit n=1 Tax=Clostridium moutaii TaxID=3240932 RepID=A0ABV4BU96_9CLOT